MAEMITLCTLLIILGICGAMDKVLDPVFEYLGVYEHFGK